MLYSISIGPALTSCHPKFQIPRGHVFAIAHCATPLAIRPPVLGVGVGVNAPNWGSHINTVDLD